MALGNTVYDRMKKTGYIMGKGHSMSPAMEAASGMPPARPAGRFAPGRQEQPERMEPPNLRDAGDEAESCGDCNNWDGIGRCLKFRYPTTANQVCDDFEEKEEENPEEDQAEGGEEEGADMGGEEEAAPMRRPVRPGTRGGY